MPSADPFADGILITAADFAASIGGLSDLGQTASAKLQTACHIACSNRPGQ